jgi:hypothetical protein
MLYVMSYVLFETCVSAVNLVHGFTLPGVPVRHEDLDIVVIRWVLCYVVVSHVCGMLCYSYQHVHLS